MLGLWIINSRELWYSLRWQPTFIVSGDTSPIGNKIPDRKFYWSTDYKFHSRLGILNCKSDWSAEKFARKLMLLRKLFHQRTFFQESRWKSSKKKESLQDEGNYTTLSYQNYQEFYVRSNKDLEILLLTAPILLLTRVIL